ncbi:SRPBCC family protein [Actinomadura parmotrematis]|uniref:SRPBCC family protein n=1 Tax=Actinomadura parmotrematis TaxID=2864039 RepID=A0ABS7FKJ2_9ACTN|nr:SRPBCC family protein [Actinomadura parmotrematis]MBW8480871.1 SRPBCC family protein [Actinomadura parmotrematis]
MADRTSSSISVAAGRGAIMAVIADLGAYPSWASGIKSIEVGDTYPDGRAKDARLTFDGGPFSDTVDLVYTWDGDAAVHWELVGKGAVVTGLHGSYTLAEGPDATEVTYELAVDVRVPMIGMVKRKGEKRIIDSALKGLKRHVEG